MKPPSKTMWSSCTDTVDLRGRPAVPVRTLASLDTETMRLKVGWMCLKLFCRGVTCSASSSVEKICEVNWASWGENILKIVFIHRTQETIYSICCFFYRNDVRDLLETMRCRWGLHTESIQPLENMEGWWGCRNNGNTDSCCASAKGSSAGMAWL